MASKSIRPREAPPRGLKAEEARRIVDHFDNNHRIIAKQLRADVDKHIRINSERVIEHLEFPIPITIAGVPNFFTPKNRRAAIKLLLDGLRADGYYVACDDEDMNILVKWGDEARDEFQRIERARQLKRELAEKKKKKRDRRRKTGKTDKLIKQLHQLS